MLTYFFAALMHPAGRVLVAMLAAVAAFLVWDYYDDKKAASEALRVREAQIQEINNAYTSKARNARQSALACFNAGGVWSSARTKCSDPD